MFFYCLKTLQEWVVKKEEKISKQNQPINEQSLDASDKVYGKCLLDIMFIKKDTMKLHVKVF